MLSQYDRKYKRGFLNNVQERFRLTSWFFRYFLTIPTIVALKQRKLSCNKCAKCANHCCLKSYRISVTCASNNNAKLYNITVLSQTNQKGTQSAYLQCRWSPQIYTRHCSNSYPTIRQENVETRPQLSAHAHTRTEDTHKHTHTHTHTHTHRKREREIISIYQSILQCVRENERAEKLIVITETQ